MSFVRDMVKRAVLCAVLLAFGVCVGALTMWLLGAWMLGGAR
jgi:hypothetical protein